MNGFDLKPESSMTKNELKLTYHRLNEAFKHAYAQRSYFGDPEFVDLQKV